MSKLFFFSNIKQHRFPTHKHTRESLVVAHSFQIILFTKVMVMCAREEKMKIFHVEKSPSEGKRREREKENEKNVR